MYDVIGLMKKHIHDLIMILVLPKFEIELILLVLYFDNFQNMTIVRSEFDQIEMDEMVVHKVTHKKLKQVLINVKPMV